VCRRSCCPTDTRETWNCTVLRTRDNPQLHEEYPVPSSGQTWVALLPHRRKGDQTCRTEQALCRLSRICPSSEPP
jgi:hypothetical protein